MRRLDWLASVGVRKVNLSGGEPTIRPDLPHIIHGVEVRGMQSAMTTNGIRLSPEVLAALVAAGTKVKVSIHGPPDHHDTMLGRHCFDTVCQTVDRLMSEGVPIAIQTVVTCGRPDAWLWVLDFCLARDIRKFRILPFVPRGRGLLAQSEYSLTLKQRQHLVRDVQVANTEFAGRLNLRVIDFWTQEYFVVETDGLLQIQRESDAADSTVAHLG